MSNNNGNGNGNGNKVGRPSKYDPEIFPSIARMLKRRDATDAQIAEALMVSVMTLERWKEEHPEFCEALKMSRQACHGKLTDSLFDMANGYTYKEEVLNKDGVIVEVTKYIPKNPTMGIFLAGNLLGFHDVRHHELTGKDGKPIAIENNTLSKLSVDKLKQIVQWIEEEEKAQAPAEPSPQP